MVWTLSEPLWPILDLKARRKLSRIKMNEVEFVSRLIPWVETAEVQAYFDEIRDNITLYNHLELAMAAHKAPAKSIIGGIDLDEAEIIYALVRLMKPDTIVETGVSGGVTSTFILEALSANGKGRLFSVDLPIAALVDDGLKNWWPKGKQPGWLIPEALRERWTLVLGKSEERLRPLLTKLGEIDIFLHDSLHTFRNERFEHNSAWPFIRLDGVLLSHDVSLPYLELCRMMGVSPIRYKKLGGIRKVR